MRRSLVFSLVSLVLLALAASANAGVAPRVYSPGPASPSLRSLVGALGARASNAADVRYAYLRKLDSHLQNLATARLGNRSVPAAATREGVTLNGGSTAVDVYVNGDVDSAAAKLRALGMQVNAVSRVAPERMVEGLLPVSALTDAAALGATHAVLATFSGTDTGSVDSQGDAAHHGPQARALGPTGAGVTVGVISDSINTAGAKIAGSQSTGNLPGPTSVPPGQVTSLLDDPAGIDEGRAMAEIIFDEAPGVRSMFFSSGTLGAAVKAQSINNLVGHGAKVIADDIFYLTEPFFQDGIVSRAVDSAKAAGVAYFASAGNRARQSWEGTYTPIPDSSGFGSPSTNDFGSADAVQTIGPFAKGRSLQIALQWDEPFGAATTDLALDVYVGGGYFGTVDGDNIATGVPQEIARFTMPSMDSVGIAIRRVAGARTPFMKYIAFAPGSNTFNIAEHPTNSNTINPDAASANGALTVAASNWNTPPTPEVYSSRGPAFRLFDAAGNRLPTPDVRQKPDVAAADGVSTSVSASFNPFFGTSAATPSDAGIGVLLRSANPGMPVDELYAILRNPANTIDCTLTAGVPDNDCGFGFDLADTAVQQALDTSPPAISPSTNPGAPNGAHGWFTVPVTVNWSVTDGQSPVVNPNGCGGPTQVTSEGATPLTCTATSAGGTSSSSVTVKHDESAPTGLKFSGISAKHYSPSKVPSASKIHCTATDAGSGVNRCTVSGFKKKVGKHKLTGTATNDAGLNRTRRRTYTVDAIGGLRLPKRFSLASLFNSGLPITIDVAKGTKITAKLTASVSGTTAARTAVLGSFKKTAKKAGKLKLRLKLSSAGKRTLSSGKVKKIKLTVAGKAGGKTTTLKRTFRLS